MSGFVSGTSRRLTVRRLVVTMLVCLVAAAALGVFATLAGIATDRDGRFLEILGPGAFDDPIKSRILEYRFTRVLATFLIGGALAAAGCALQALLRNPLAEPFTLGISSGSSLAAVIAMRFGVGDVGISAAALGGAIAALGIVWQLARIGRQLPPATLVLAGVTMAMFCSSATVLIQYTTDFMDMPRMMVWMMGSLESVTWDKDRLAIAPILTGLVVLVFYSRELNALAAGPEVAASLGVAVGRTQTVVFIVASLLVGVSISLAGPIGFIGLVVPHALRAVIGPDHRLLVPASILGGAIVLTACDVLARTLFAPARLLPTGAVTTVLGIPVFFMILLRHKRRAGLWSN
jgi:iron complex transport system permease protein